LSASLHFLFVRPFLPCHFLLVFFFFARHRFLVFALLPLEFLRFPHQFFFLLALLALLCMLVLLRFPFHFMPLFLCLPLHFHFLFFGFYGGFIHGVCERRQWRVERQA